MTECPNLLSNFNEALTVLAKYERFIKMFKNPGPATSTSSTSFNNIRCSLMLSAISLGFFPSRLAETSPILVVI